MISARVPASLKSVTMSLTMQVTPGCHLRGRFKLTQTSLSVPSSFLFPLSFHPLNSGLGLVGSAAGPLLFGLAAGRGWLSSLPAVLIVASALSAGVWMSVPRNQRRDD